MKKKSVSFFDTSNQISDENNQQNQFSYHQDYHRRHLKDRAVLQKLWREAQSPEGDVWEPSETNGYRYMQQLWYNDKEEA